MPLYYDKNFQSVALAWWRTLSINQQKALGKKHGTVMSQAPRSEIAEFFDRENPIIASTRTFSFTIA